MSVSVIDQLEEYWSERSSSYSEQNMIEMHTWKRDAWRKKILTNAPLGTKLKILDVGTGPGFFAINLSMAGHHVTAVDITDDMLEKAKENAAKYKVDIQFKKINGDRLPFPDNYFDLVVNRDVIWNLEHPKQALEEWKRVLRVGGRMIYFDANWYLYLFDKKLAEKKRVGREMAKKFYPEREAYSAEMAKEKVRMLEDVAKGLPLSAIKRPSWDKNVLQEINMHVLSIQDVSLDLYDDWERLEYLSSPSFMVCAEKMGKE